MLNASRRDRENTVQSLPLYFNESSSLCSSLFIAPPLPDYCCGVSLKSLTTEFLSTRIFTLLSTSRSRVFSFTSTTVP